jgi:hypothetical protein
MADRTLEAPPGFVYTLFGLEPAPLAPIWLGRTKADAGVKKLCTFCRESKSVSQFNLSKLARDGIHPHCKLCRNALAKDRYRKCRKAKARVTDVHRLKAYGMTREDFDRMFAQQGGDCEICQLKLQPGRGTHIDHCHTTGRVRALLCAPCNSRVGLVENTTVEVGRYIAYVKKYAAANDARAPAQSLSPEISYRA